MAGTPNLISLTEAADRLGVHYMTAYRYVRTGRLAAVKDGHEWQVDETDVAALLAAPAPTPGPRKRAPRGDRTDRLVELLLRSDEAGAWTLVETALTGGLAPAEVYLDLLGPALATIGRRWDEGTITVADEHRASAVVLRLIGRLGPNFARRGRKRGTVVLGTAPGDRHGLPGALLRDLLRGARFDVVDLGADVPLESWAATVVATPRLLAVGLCATVPGNDENVAATVSVVRDSAGVPVVVGGGAIEGPGHASALGADVHSVSFDDAVRAFEDLTGRPPQT
jgi:excisionase family DNA binding protein